MQRGVFETLAYYANQLIERRIEQAPFDKSYSGLISDILFEPDTPMDSSKFGTYKIRYGTKEKIVRLSDNFVHEIGERVEVYIYENNPNHIVVEPVIKRMPPCKIKYDDKENKYIEYRRTQTNGKIYETKQEYKLTEIDNDDGQEVTKMELPDGHIINFENWNT